MTLISRYQKLVEKLFGDVPSAEAKTTCIARIEVDTEEIVRRIKGEYDITDRWIPCSERLPEKDGSYLVPELRSKDGRRQGKRGRRMTREALSYAQISVEVLNDHCWQDCEDFEPWLHNSTYATNLGGTCIYSRHFQCKNMNKCKQISLHLERSGDTE